MHITLSFLGLLGKFKNIDHSHTI